MFQKLYGPLLILFCSLLWATDTLFRYPLSHHVDSAFIVLFEHLFALVILVPILQPKRDEIAVVAAKNFWMISFIGIFGSAFATMALTKSYSTINPSVAILLQKLQPVVSIIFARIILKEKPKNSFYFLGLLAIASATVLSIPEIVSGFSISFSDQNLIGVLLALSSAIAWGLCTVLGRKMSLQSNSSPMTTTFLRFGWGFMGMILYFLIFRKFSDIREAKIYLGMHPKGILAIFYMSIISGIFAMNLYYSGLKKTKASIAAFAELSFPFFAVIVNWVVLGQALTSIQIAAALVLLGSVMAISKNY